MAETKEESKSNEESVKLFVGQVPKHMTEDELLTLFKEFAIVDEVNIIKDKATRASRGSFFFFKSRILRFSNRFLLIPFFNPNFLLLFFFVGCCFVICPSRDEADKAVNACHNKKTLPGVSLVIFINLFFVFILLLFFECDLFLFNSMI
jgi:CUG-BP- and ETR3-like factor